VDVFTCRGSAPGPTALIVGGVHGDEYEGPAAIWKVAETLRPEQVSGTVVLIPVASPLAFEAGTRVTPPDSVNLARVFPGNPEGSPTERLAYFLFETFGRTCDFLIDLHSGGVEYDFLPVSGFRGEPAPENPSFAAARAMGLPILWQLPDRPGIFSREVSRLGAVTVGTEYRGMGQLSREGEAEYARGILNCLALWGVYHGAVEPVPQPHGIYTSRWLLCPVAGVFTTRLRLGDAFAAGEVLAELRDVRGQVLAEITAEEPGTILALRSKAYARAGDWALLHGLRLPGICE
jgi:N-alpha-acetyl-L-2,4-diaminobutyrate deacetylase